MEEKISISAKIAIAGAVLSVVFGLWSGYISSKTYKTQYRPYVGIEKINIEKNTERINASIILINTGIVPANNIKFEFFQLVNGVKYYGIEPQESSLLMPSPAYQIIRFYASKNVEEEEWVIKFLVRYNGIKTKGHETSITAKYNKETNAFNITDGYAE